jgi:hypothetical protein
VAAGEAANAEAYGEADGKGKGEGKGRGEGSGKAAAEFKAEADEGTRDCGGICKWTEDGVAEGNSKGDAPEGVASGVTSNGADVEEEEEVAVDG